MTDAGNWLAINKIHQQPKRGNSVLGHTSHPQAHEVANKKLLNDYFVDDLVYSFEIFKRRFRMRGEFFL